VLVSYFLTNHISRARHLRSILFLLTLCDFRLNITQILPSFTMLYAQILKRPSLLSARSDAELLVITAQVIDHYLCGTPEKKTMSEIIQSMAAAASSAVTSSSTSSRGRTSDNVSNLSPASLSSRNTNQASTSPASLEENTPTSSDTPLSFYFNVAPNHQTHDPSASGLDSRPANVQGDLETSLFAMDAVTMPAAMDLPPNQSPTDPSLWFPPY
jgi:hypothetical protein